MAHDPFYDLVPPPAHAPLTVDTTALLVIDLQYLDAHPAGWMGRLCREQGKPGLLDERWTMIEAALPNVRALQDRCRALGIDVLHIRVAYQTRDGRDGGRSLARSSPSTPFLPQDDEFLPLVAPIDDEIVINKTSAGAFNSTNIDRILRNLGVRRLLVTGIVTEGCVELTARDAADRGFDVTLVADACASSSRTAHLNALERMGDGGQIEVRDTVGVLSELEQLAT